MRPPTVVSLTVLAFAVMSCSAAWAAEEAPKHDATEAYPAEVSLLEEPPHGWTYRQFPDNLPLYYYDKDTAKKSRCTRGCDTKWIPLLAPRGAKAVGGWTLVARQNGRKQWAYQQKPVYVLIHDSVEKPTGDNAEGHWHLLPHFQ